MAALTEGTEDNGILRAVLATGNTGKLREFQSLLGEYIWLTPQSELGIRSPPETGTTFTENALIKARNASGSSGLPAIADDSGLEVDVLDGAPGIRSARYAGEGSSDDENLRLLLENLTGIAAADRTARFRCVAVLVRSVDDPDPIIAEGVWEGFIATQSSGDNGFGYDPVFLDGRSGVTAAQLTAAEKNLRSHRGAAARQLRKMMGTLIGREERD